MLDHLVPPPDGLQFPEGADLAIIAAADGVRLRAMLLKPAAMPCRGTIFVLQGRAEYIEKYGEVFIRLLARGFAIASLDWRGQGGSERQLRDPRKGHVEDFDDYLLDLDALLAEAHIRAMPEPYGLLAHSTGGAIALHALTRDETRNSLKTPFRRAVLSSPLVGIAGMAGKAGPRLLARALASIGLAGCFVPMGGPNSIFEKPFEGNPLTSDPARYANGARWITAEPELGIGDPTIGWADAAFDAMADFAEDGFGQTNRTPVLMVIAGADTVVDARASTALALRMRGASAITLHGSRHEILMERDAIQAGFWTAFDAFMQLGDVEQPAEAVQAGPA